MVNKYCAVVFSAALLLFLVFTGCKNKPEEVPEAPAPPVLVSPSNGASFLPDTLTLTWSDTSGRAASFSVQVSTDTGFAAMVTSGSATASSFPITSALSNNTTYYWRVSASDGQRTSAWSEVFSFSPGVSAPSLSSPSEGDLWMPDTLTLSWSGVDGATQYHVQVSIDNLFSTTAIDDSGSVTSFAITSPLASSTTYYWRVSVTKPQGTSAWSMARSFTTWDPLPVPTLSSPSDNATGVALTDLLNWNDPAVWAVSSYHVQVSTDANFLSGVIIDNAAIYTLVTAIASLSDATQYYWRVALIDFRQRQSGWSAIWSFTTQ
jgi:hypothetical protein